jgi:hypothetical protein
MAEYELKRFDDYSSPSLIEPDFKKKAGCFVRVTTGFILMLLVLILVTGVALIVYFVQKDSFESNNKNAPSVTSSYSGNLKGDCEALAEAGKLDQNKVCEYNSTVLLVFLT